MRKGQKKENPKDRRLELRLTSEELESIDYVSEALGLSRSKAIIYVMEERADEIYKMRLGKGKEKSP